MKVIYKTIGTGEVSETNECIFFLDDGSTVDIIDGLILEYDSGYKIFDDITREINVLWKSKLKRIISRPHDYDKWKEKRIKQFITPKKKRK